MTWRQLMQRLQELEDNDTSSKLDGEALFYRPSSGLGTGESEVIEIKHFMTIGDYLAEEFDLVEGDLILLP